MGARRSTTFDPSRGGIMPRGHWEHYNQLWANPNDDPDWDFTYDGLPWSLEEILEPEAHGGRPVARPVVTVKLPEPELAQQNGVR